MTDCSQAKIEDRHSVCTQGDGLESIECADSPHDQKSCHGRFPIGVSTIRKYPRFGHDGAAGREANPLNAEQTQGVRPIHAANMYTGMPLLTSVPSPERC